MTHGIQRHPVKYVVFAGNFREYRQWVLAAGIKNGDALYVADASNLGGVTGEDVTFVQIGTFHLREDSRLIMEYARSRWPDAPTRFIS